MKPISSRTRQPEDDAQEELYRQWFEQRRAEFLQSGALRCPYCSAKRPVSRKRCFTRRMAQAVVALACLHEQREGFHHKSAINTVCQNLFKLSPRQAEALFGGGDLAKIGLFGLVTCRRGKAEYAITQEGADFVVGDAVVWRWIAIQAGEVVSCSSDHVTIHDLLGDGFDYWEATGRSAVAS